MKLRITIILISFLTLSFIPTDTSAQRGRSKKKSKSSVDKAFDKDGDLTTPLVNNKECAFVSFDQNGTAKCSIEQAYNQGEVEFKKPISCHLFPIRIQKYDDFEAVNYESIKICEPACSCGQKLQVPVYKFLKEPLIRLYGESWYHTLSEAAVELKLEPPFNNSSN